MINGACTFDGCLQELTQLSSLDTVVFGDCNCEYKVSTCATYLRLPSSSLSVLPIMTSRGLRIFFCANVLGSLASPLVTQNAFTNVVSAALASETIASKSPAGANLFDNEAVQLTEDALRAADTTINGIDYVYLFGFENNTDLRTSSNPSQTNGDCKTFPGDSNFPRPAVWVALDRLLGGALIKTTPIGAPCYKNSGVYDAAKCADISARFTTSALQ